MTDPDAYSDYARLLCEFIGHSTGCKGRGPQQQEVSFNRAALSLFALQYAFNPAYQTICNALKLSPAAVGHWSEIPAVPTTAFKEFELTSLPPGKRQKTFHSSGTTEHRPSRHFHDAESLALYEASLLPWFKAHLLADESRWRFVTLTPPPDLAPHSSLIYMFNMVHREFGDAESGFTGSISSQGDWEVGTGDAMAVLREAIGREIPVVLLGTAFNYLQLLDHLEAVQERFQLPPGSRVMETGGYKGRTRALPRAELHKLITQRLGVPGSNIVSEYGMSELSSQAYDGVVGVTVSERIFRFPPWARVKIVSPETSREVEEGGTGLIRVFDLANMRSVMAVQTGDLGVRRGDGFELLGRAGIAEPRGCSLMSA